MLIFLLSRVDSKQRRRTGRRNPRPSRTAAAKIRVAGIAGDVKWHGLYGDQDISAGPRAGLHDQDLVRRFDAMGPRCIEASILYLKPCTPQNAYDCVP